ncbi:hypothetical protein VTL71DRAFT_11351 [Oculimacula yallundae]|uniref:RlpA-like protein double-psi beta-barrel domain-containing protein n=1 Tax=Oculimacula yallundae TaxID=86028 RepID=A0ABR4CRK9_9HELO
MKTTNFLSGVVSAMALLSGTGVGAIVGHATYYTQQGVAGSCGVYHADMDYVVALGYPWGHNNHCGEKVRIWNPKTDRSVVATVADTCPGCEQTKLDVSVGVYQYLVAGPAGSNPIDIVWDFI